MSIALKLVFRGLPHDASVESVVYARARDLMRHQGRPKGCEIVVQQREESWGDCGRFTASIRVWLASDEVVTSDGDFLSHGQETAATAVEEAFDAIEAELWMREEPQLFTSSTRLRAVRPGELPRCVAKG